MKLLEKTKNEIVDAKFTYEERMEFVLGMRESGLTFEESMGVAFQGLYGGINGYLGLRK